MMKRTVIIAMTIATIAGSAYAQDMRTPKSPEERTEQQMKWMNNNLGLTNEQSAKAHDVILKYATKRDSVAKGERSPSKRDAMEQLMQQRQTEIKAILNDEQFTKFKAHEQEMRNRIMERRRGQK